MNQHNEPVSVEPLPCPFCGGTDLKELHRHNHNAVTCNTCGASVPQSDIGYGDAGKLWNRRAALLAVEAQLPALKPLTDEQMRDVLQEAAESIDAPHIVMTHWPIVARAIEAAHSIKEQS